MPRKALIFPTRVEAACGGDWDQKWAWQSPLSHQRYAIPAVSLWMCRRMGSNLMFIQIRVLGVLHSTSMKCSAQETDRSCAALIHERYRAQGSQWEERWWPAAARTRCVESIIRLSKRSPLLLEGHCKQAWRSIRQRQQQAKKTWEEPVMATGRKTVTTFKALSRVPIVISWAQLSCHPRKRLVQLAF